MEDAKPDDAEQSKRFIKTAREIEVDERPESFEKAFSRVTKKKPPASPES